MSKFKVGDKVRRLNSANFNPDRTDFIYPGEVGIIIAITGTTTDECYNLDIHPSILNDPYNLELVEELIENKKINMLEKFAQMFLSEPTKTFRKAGIINDKGMLTDDGQKIFLTWLLNANGEKFKTEIVDELLKENK